MNIEVGKCYKNPSGLKIEVLRFFKRDRQEFIVGLYTDPDGRSRGSWDSVSHAQQNWTPWIDEPAIPWDSVPEWCQWWAMSEQGGQMFFQERPLAGGLYWSQKTDTGVVIVPKTHRIPYVGDWRESLRQRPGKEVK
jgi:hypothetical protein